MSRLSVEAWVPLAPVDVFPFFADAANLEVITPPWLRFRIVTPQPIEMRAGALIDYRLRLHGIPIRWRTAITRWEPPFQFVDEQVRGPYRLWRHTHTFEECSGGTQMRDEVEYAVPGGRVIEKFFVRRDLSRIFEYRRARTEELLTSSSPASGV